MHHVVLDRWSRGRSPLHRLDPRAKLLVLAVFLIVLATTQKAVPIVSAGFFAVLVAAIVSARLPLSQALLRAGVVFTLTLVFGGITWLSGDHWRAVSLVLKSYLSALAVLLVVSTTPLPLLLRGLEMAGLPRFLLMVTQFLYRYLFVISEEAQHMAKSAASRGATAGQMLARQARFRAAAGALAALFARSYSRADEIHRAMLARGFEGRFRTLGGFRFGRADAVFAAVSSACLILFRIVVERQA